MAESYEVFTADVLEPLLHFGVEGKDFFRDPNGRVTSIDPAIRALVEASALESRHYVQY